jgi:hypothetical protein
MITVYTILFIATSLMINIKIFAQPDKDPLWQKAVEIAEKNVLWIPGLMVENETVFNQKGKLEERTERQIQFIRNEEGFIQTKLLKSVINGKDVSEEERKQIEGSDEHLEQDESDSPFAPRLQENVTAIRSPKTEWLNSVECVVFNYTQKTEDVSLKGKAWLAKDSGIPLKIQYNTSDTIKED